MEIPSNPASNAPAKNGNNLGSTVALPLASRSELRASENRYRRLFETARDGIIILDAANRKITDANPFMVQLAGVSRGEFEGKRLWEVGLLPDAGADDAALDALLTEGALRFETRLQNAETSAFFDLEIVANAYVEGDELEGHSVVQCNVRDISERKRGEQAQAQLAAVVDSSDDAIFSIGLDGLISSWNGGARQLYGYSAPEVIGKSLTLLFLPTQARQIDLILKNVWCGATIRNLETIPAGKNGAPRTAFPNPDCSDLDSTHKIARNGTADRRTNASFSPPVQVANRRRFPSRDDDFAQISLTISPLYDAEGELRGAAVVARDISEQKRASQASGRSEKLYRALTTNFPNGAVYLLDLEGRFFLAEGRGMTIVGLSPEDFLGKTIGELVMESSAHTRLSEVFQRAARGEESVAEVEIAGRFRSLRGVPVRDDGGKTAFVLVMTQDVTERKVAESALSESEMRMRALVESLDDVVFEFDAQGTYLNVWASNETLLAQPKAALLGRRISEIAGEDIAQLYLQAITQIFAGETAEIFEYPLEVGAGKRWFTARLSPVLGAGGGVKSVCTLVRDITETKRVYEALEQTNREIVTIWESMSDAFYALDNDWNVTRMNAQAAALLHKTPDELLGKNIWDEFPEALGLRFYQEFHRAMREQVPVVFEEFFEPLEMWSETRVYPSAVGLSIYFNDITGRKRDEQALRISEARFHSIVSNVPGMVYQFALHADGTFEFPFISEGCRDLAGLEPEAVRRNPMLLVQILDPADQLEYQRTVAHSAATLRPWVWEGRGRLASGRTKWVQGVARPREMPDGTTLWDGLLVDISARKEAEDERDRFFTLSPDMLGIAGRDGYFKRVNPAFEAVLGYPAAEITARPMLELIHPDDREVTLREMESLGRGLSAANFVNRYFCQSGAMKWLSWHVVPYEDLFYVAAHDITPLVEAENALRYANEELEVRVTRRTAELAAAKEEEGAARREAESANLAKSEFLSRMSHELRTPLNAILGFGQILQAEPISRSQSEQVTQILQGGWHLLGLINEILDISRVEAGHLEIELATVSLSALVMESCALVRPLAAQRNVRLDESAVIRADHCVLADRQRLKQVLINLLSNAIKYNRHGGQVNVFCAARPDGQIRLSVHDTGPGISAADQLKLFMPFERLHATDSDIEGTGLGLVLSRRLMTAMSGTLGLQSEVGQGSTFWFELPPATEPLQPALSAPDATSFPGHQLSGHTYSVLSIEDNLSNLRLLEAILENRPEVTLMAAAQGQSGLHLAREHRFDLILLDLNLPDIDGAEVLTELQKLEKTRQIPVIVVSADATPPQIDRLLGAGARAYLTKPLDVAEFLSTLDEALLASPPVASRQKGSVAETALPLISLPAPDANFAANDEDDASVARQNWPQIPARSLQILVAEDNLVNQKVVRHQLQNLGHHPTICDNGYALIQTWQSGNFDLILMDCHMPKMDGYATTREIRYLEAQNAAKRAARLGGTMESANGGNSEDWANRPLHIPIIALTANALSGDREKSLAAGMDDHLGKPVNQAELAATLVHWSQISDAAIEATFATRPAPVKAAATEKKGNVFAGESALQPERWRELQSELDADLLCELVQLFLEEVPQLIGDLKAAAQAQNSHDAYEIAHKLKGSCATMGAAQLSVRCRNIEQAAHEENWSDLDVQAQQLEAEFETAQRELQSYLDEATPE